MKRPKGEAATSYCNVPYRECGIHAWRSGLKKVDEITIRTPDKDAA
jgi:hypothetical protein